jgi:hypothetical protein
MAVELLPRATANAKIVWSSFIGDPPGFSSNKALVTPNVVLSGALQRVRSN